MLMKKEKNVSSYVALLELYYRHLGQGQIIFTAAPKIEAETPFILLNDICGDIM